MNSSAAINHTKAECPPNNRGPCSDDQLFSVRVPHPVTTCARAGILLASHSLACVLSLTIIIAVGFAPFQWSRPYFHSPNTEGGPGGGVFDTGGNAWYAVSPEDEKRLGGLSDSQIAAHAAETLRDFKAAKLAKRFFLAVGFHRPVSSNLILHLCAPTCAFGL
eukprot:COSAG02_NODE_206_length_29144_cov_12.855121_25_plen_163_part_00